MKPGGRKAWPPRGKSERRWGFEEGKRRHRVLASGSPRFRSFTALCLEHGPHGSSTQGGAACVPSHLPSGAAAEQNKPNGQTNREFSTARAKGSGCEVLFIPLPGCTALGEEHTGCNSYHGGRRPVRDEQESECILSSFT